MADDPRTALRTLWCQRLDGTFEAVEAVPLVADDHVE
jgi:hypothetical protein